MDGLEVLLRATVGLPHIPFYFQRVIRPPQTGIGLCFFRDMPVKGLSKLFGGKVFGLHPISSFGTAFIVFFYQDRGFFLAFCPPAPFTFLFAPDQYPVHFTDPFQWMALLPDMAFLVLDINSQAVFWSVPSFPAITVEGQPFVVVDIPKRIKKALGKGDFT